MKSERSISVSTAPGATENAFTPIAFPSLAQLWAMTFSEALLDAYAKKPGNGSSVPYVETFDRRRDPRGRVYFWSKPDFHCPEPHPDSDVTALAEGYVTVTPLQFNLTQAALLEQMQGWHWQL